MNKAIFRGGLTFASGISCAAVTFAFKDNPLAAVLFSVLLAVIMMLFCLAKED